MWNFEANICSQPHESVFQLSIPHRRSKAATLDAGGDEEGNEEWFAPCFVGQERNQAGANPERKCGQLC